MRTDSDVAASRPPTAVPFPGRVESMDSARGIAALVVMLFHALMLEPYFSDHLQFHPGLPAGSFAGWLLLGTPLRVLVSGSAAVLVFFVLSGFVLALPWMAGRPPAYGRFVGRRFCRLYLPYAAAVLLAATASSLLAPYYIAGGSEWFNLGGWSRPVDRAALLDHALLIGNRQYINPVVWSLIWEMRVSLVFPLLALAILRWRLTGAVLMALLVFPVATLLLRHAVPGNPVLQAAADLFFWATFFVPGACIALYAPSIRAWLGARSEAVRLGLLASGLMLVWYQWPLQEQRIDGVGATLIVASLLSPGRIEHFLRHPVLTWLGRISFSLYLVHVPVLLGGNILLHAWLPRPILIPLLILVSLPLAHIFHLAVEAPSMRAGQRLFPRVPARTTATGYPALAGSGTG